MRIFFVVLLSVAALANPGQDATDELGRKGLLKDTSSGSRAATRYELVELMDRVMRLHETITQGFVTKSDLEPVRQAVQSVRAVLESLELRVGETEKAVEREDRRTGE